MTFKAVRTKKKRKWGPFALMLNVMKSRGGVSSFCLAEELVEGLVDLWEGEGGEDFLHLCLYLVVAEISD